MPEPGFGDFAAGHFKRNGGLTHIHVFGARALCPGLILRGLWWQQGQTRSQSVQRGHFLEWSAGQNRQRVALIAEIIFGGNLLRVRKIRASLSFLLVRNRGGTDLKVALRALELQCDRALLSTYGR